MKRIGCVLALLVPLFVATTSADDSDKLLTVDHYVRVKSTVPAIAGQPAQLYVRERVTAGAALRAPSLADRVVLFVHGAGTPAEVTFDVPYQDYSWMAFLARVSLVAWSRGGPRAGGYASQHPDKIRRLVLLAPAYSRTGAANATAVTPADGVPMNTQSHQEFVANWDRQVGCAEQYDRAASDAVWSDMLESDPVGATWGPGVRRAPESTGSWTPALVGKATVPTLMITGAHDKQVPSDRVRELYADLGSPEKVFVDLACSSHNAMWERNHLLLFRASLERLTNGSVNGMKTGMLKLGYAGVPESR